MPVLSCNAPRIPTSRDAISTSTHLSTPHSVQSDISENNCLPCLHDIHPYCEEKACFLCLLLYTEEPIFTPLCGSELFFLYLHSLEIEKASGRILCL